jgi:PadR family transcriptional regulator PadR
MHYSAGMDLNTWQTQLRKGAVELVVLTMLARSEAYGLELLERVNAAGEMIGEGSFYPLLTRLEKAGKVAARWDTESGVNPRKYYRLTDEGEALRAAMIERWGGFRAMMDRLV